MKHLLTRGATASIVLTLFGLLMGGMMLTSATFPDSEPTSPDDPMMKTFSTFLMFEGDAEEAINLYTEVFPEAEIINLERYGAGEEGPEGTISAAEVMLGDQRLRFFDSPAPHEFTFTPSISIFVDFTSGDELDAAYARLADGGQIAMPLGDYPFSTRFGWLVDRFGVSWQLNLP